VIEAGTETVELDELGELHERRSTQLRLIARESEFLAAFVNYPAKLAPFPVREAARHSRALGWSECVRHGLAISPVVPPTRRAALPRRQPAVDVARPDQGTREVRPGIGPPYTGADVTAYQIPSDASTLASSFC
jgi:hypothetical protein